jgi:hypothetical protein
MERRQEMTVAKLLPLVGLIGIALIVPAPHAQAEPAYQACQPGNLLGQPLSDYSCRMGYAAMIDQKNRGLPVILHNDPNSLTGGRDGSLCQALGLRNIDMYAHPGGAQQPVFPDFLYGCEAAKRSLMAEGYP